MTVDTELQQAIRKVGELVSPSVVHVGRGWRGGSGFVLSAGHVLTNAHNVRHESVAVRFADGRRADGTLTGVDVDGDLAVLAVDTGDAPPLEWSTDEGTELGLMVFGVAGDGGGTRVTVGHVSSLGRAFRGPRGRRISDSVEHTAPLAAGSSGSPLVNAAGRLVGINTNRLGDGFYLALPASDGLRRRVDALQRGESAERPRLGVGLAPAWEARRMRRSVGLPDRDGLLVRELEQGGPAQRAGLEVGDLIVAAGDRPVSDVDDLHDTLAGTIAEGGLRLHVVRGVDERVVEVRFGPAAEGDAGPVH